MLASTTNNVVDCQLRTHHHHSFLYHDNGDVPTTTMHHKHVDTMEHRAGVGIRYARKLFHFNYLLIHWQYLPFPSFDQLSTTPAPPSHPNMRRGASVSSTTPPSRVSTRQTHFQSLPLPRVETRVRRVLSPPSRVSTRWRVFSTLPILPSC